MSCRFICACFLLALSIFCCQTAYAGKVELTTYYPAPYGEYKTVQLKAGQENQTAPVTALTIAGPNQPSNLNSAQDIEWSFSAAGSSILRSYRDGSWGTHIQFLTNSTTAGSDSPQVRMHISENGSVGIGTAAPAAATAKLEVNNTLRLTPVTGLAAAQADGLEGSLRYSSTEQGFVYKNSSGWVPLGGGGGCYIKYSSGSCLTGFTNKGSLGGYGQCTGLNGVNAHYCPPGGTCHAGLAYREDGEAFLCCQS